jgi:hypothetical protein
MCNDCLTTDGCQMNMGQHSMRRYPLCEVFKNTWQTSLRIWRDLKAPSPERAFLVLLGAAP